MDKNEILETIKAAKDYLSALKGLENEVKVAEEQIENSASEAERLIKETFSNLLEEVKKTLQNRQQILLQQIGKVKKKSVNPLEDCRRVIVTKIDNTESFINIGHNIVTNSQKFDAVIFDKNTSTLGSLPEVPQLKEVPCISYSYEPVVYKNVIDLCKSFGCVTSIAPVQISGLTEKPGSILVEFECIEQEDKLTDIQEFRLQKAFANATNITFQDCYIGSESQYLARDLQINETYVFRVCCKFEGSSSWSSWSIPQSHKTTIKPYSWKENKTYILRNENRIAKSNDESPNVLFSDGAQFHVGYSVEFTFLECDVKLDGNYIGLSLSNNVTAQSLMSESVLVEATGDVYVNGVKKNTRLPEMHDGSKVCFTCEQLNESKILMNVECGGKQVTYEWLLNSDDTMFFLASFNSSRWKVMVE